MTTTRGNPSKTAEPQRIVVGIDGSEASLVALRWAAGEARLRAARLEVVHAWHPPYVGGYPYTGIPLFDPDSLEDSAAVTLDKAIAGIHASDLAYPIERIASKGGASAVLLEVSKGADLVVLGSRGLGGFASLLLGSVSHQVVQHAECPVVIVPSS